MAREAAEMTRPTKLRAGLVLCPSLAAENGEKMPAKVAHDLLGVVTIIQGFAELLQSEPDAKLRGEYSGRITRACRRLVDMIDGSRKNLSVKKQPVDLARFLGDCLAVQTIAAKKKGISLRLDLGSTLGLGRAMVSIDPGCVERIVGNLLENAIKFSLPTTTITLRASILDDSLTIAVEDDGQGIPEAELATLFNAYQTGSVRPTGGERSTGLGLSIVKELVQAHHGVVGVRSRVGRGSTFSIRLPLETELTFPLPMFAGG
jgi:two-component system sensor histidine kinase/response regulator